jgi:hypothetical protein
MGILGNNPFVALGNPGTGYQIEQSLRFNSADSAYLNRTPGSSGSTTTWTISTWVKRASLGVAQMIWSAGTSGVTYLTFNADDTLKLRNSTVEYTTNWRFRDPSAWYHIVVKWDTTNSTQADRAIIYVNGVALGTGDYSTYDQATSSEASTWNTNVAHNLGRYAFNSTSYLSAYLAEVNFIDGSALDHEDFGEFDNNGVWRPIKYAGSYTGNSFYLKFASGDGTDSSGLSNTWTANNFTTSGTGTDVMSDTPTTNWCTLDPLTNGSYATLSDGNLSAYGNNSSDNGNSRTNFAVTTGKWYCEFTCVASTGGYPQLGIMRQYDASRPNNGSPQSGYSSGMLYPTQSCSYWPNGQLSINSVDTLNWGSTWTAGDTIAIALDGDNGAVYFAKNNTWQNSGDPTSGSSKTGAALTWTDVRDYVFTIASYNGSDIDANFGQRAFAYTPPTGFNALNTANLPAPDIADGSKNFNTVLYNGNGSTQSITGVGFQPDWVWLKSRSNAYHNYVFDVIRGTGKQLYTNLTNEEFTSSGTLTSFDTDGFSLGNSANADINNSSATFVAWNWLAGGSVSADNNTNGSITSTVSANPSAGFSIVTYTGNGTSGATVGHGLGVKPSLLIVRRRPTTSNWTVYHSSVGATKRLVLDSTAGATAGTGFWNDTEPTSTVFSIGNDGGTNSTTNNTYVAYCFAEVEGYSKFGSYTGNGNADGPFVYCGFRPAFVLTKNTNATNVDDWSIEDATRDTYNLADASLRPNSDSIEDSAATIDILSNGFKVRTGNSHRINFSGEVFIFAAFASSPFGGFRTTPATAR